VPIPRRAIPRNVFSQRFRAKRVVRKLSASVTAEERFLQVILRTDGRTGLSRVETPRRRGGIWLITFCVSRRRRKMYRGHARLCVCLSVRDRTPTLLHGPGCNLEAW